MTATPTNPTRRSARPTARRSAFTLIEVLAALLLLAIVLPAIMQGVALATSAGSIARQRTEAAALCQSKLDEIVSTGEWQTSNLSGDFSATDQPEYRWTAQVQNWPQQQGVQELDVVVSWTAGGTERSLSLSTLIYPNAGAAAAGSSSGTGTGSTGGTGARTGGAGGGR